MKEQELKKKLALYTYAVEVREYPKKVLDDAMTMQKIPERDKCEFGACRLKSVKKIRGVNVCCLHAHDIKTGREDLDALRSL